MPHDRPTHEPERGPLAPDDVAAAGGERSDGRPEGVPQRSGPDLEGRPDVVRNPPVDTSGPADEAPTVAPEERGEEPETEHAPGADL